ncbi:Sorting nexin-2-like protein [Leptotrombidium deliense]|uniref:Sorting nexin-2 n=1 Tax=Leptotrombidium deliense TaxID=299467 RepID=A0A443SJG2_9ACAR|nr:Sorting nexin-2-like protein [Leptotrombidium deliense]
MAESTNPPPFSNQQFGKEEDDDNEDLFVSAIEVRHIGNHSKQASNENIKSSSTTIEDMMSGSGGDEIDLGDDTDVPTPVHSITVEEQSSFHTCTPDEENTDERNDPPAESKATLPTSSATTIGETVNVKTTSSIPAKVDAKKEVMNEVMEIKVGEATRVGDGMMNSHVVYKVTTKTNLPYFRKNVFSVNRRFSDFLGLRDKLAEKHVHLGRIVPPAPEKDAVGTAKVKMSKEDSLSSEFIDKRRAALERFLCRLAVHPTLKTDPDFREFLELDTELPKATNTSALSGAGVRRLFNKVGDTVNKMTYRMDESDPWFEEKQNQIDSLDQQLRKLYSSVEALIHHRKELTLTTGAFAKSAAMLGNSEEHTSLSCALSQLAETEEKIEQLYAEQVNRDVSYLSELLKDYIALIGAVKDVFHQRVKVYQTWQHAQQTLMKKRDQKVKLELAGRQDKISQINEEVLEWESKVSRGQEEFEGITKTIKGEMEKFEMNRICDFKANIITYMEGLLESQQQLIKYWEAFLPEAKAIA